MRACFAPYSVFNGFSCLLRKNHFKKYGTHTFVTNLMDEMTSKEDVLRMAQADIMLIPEQIKRTVSHTPLTDLSQLCQYPFDKTGKLVRPLVVTLISATVNSHLSITPLDHAMDSSTYSKFDQGRMPPCLPNEERKLERYVLPSQHSIALIAEMIHTASLVQDDVLDCADTRRGRTSAQAAFGQRQAIQAGDFIWITASQLLAQLKDSSVIRVLATVIEDLIKGELMQMIPLDEEDNKRFKYYLSKTYRKTSSLIANSCKAAALLVDPSANASPPSSSTDKFTESFSVTEAAYQFGYHVGMTFQLLDDVLDFEQTSEDLGKPSGGADLKLGIATGPVLFAAERFPHLNSLISRRFSRSGDIEEVANCVQKADGVGQTRLLAEFHLSEALRCLNLFKDTCFRKCAHDYVVDLYHRQK